MHPKYTERTRRFPRLECFATLDRTRTHTRPLVSEDPIVVFGDNDVQPFASVHRWTGNPRSNAPHIYMTATVAANLHIAAAERADPPNPKEIYGTLYGEVGLWNGALTIWITSALWVRAASSSWAEVKIPPELYHKVWAHEEWYWPKRRLLGWFHSHPGHGLKFSEIDQDNQLRNYDLPWQIGLLLETKQRKAAYYYWNAAKRLAGPGIFAYQEVTDCMSKEEKEVYRRRKALISMSGRREFVLINATETDREITACKHKPSPSAAATDIQANREFQDWRQIPPRFEFCELKREQGQREVHDFAEVKLAPSGGSLLLDRKLAADLVRVVAEQKQGDPACLLCGYLGGETFTHQGERYFLIYAAVLGWDKQDPRKPDLKLQGALQAVWRKMMGRMPPLALLWQRADAGKPVEIWFRLPLDNQSLLKTQIYKLDATTQIQFEQSSPFDGTAIYSLQEELLMGKQFGKGARSIHRITVPPKSG